MRVAFRTDASIDIGNGHIMRCLTLALQLREQGSTCVFICRPHPGNLIEKISKLGFDVAALPATADAGPALCEDHARIGADWATDARQTLAVLGAGVDWMVVDHYALDARWESAVRCAARRVLVIDDLANRRHDADLLVDQNAGREAAHYQPRVPGRCEVLAGPRFALLRSEFGAHREASRRRRCDKMQHLLVCMGGVDKDNATAAVLDSLASAALPGDATITVVLGLHAPHIADIRQRAAKMRWPTQVIVDVDDMAGLMAECDLAIGAAGVSALERCCVGLPSIIIPVAANQMAGARALDLTGAAMLASLEPSGTPHLRDAIDALLADGALQAASTACAAVTDGGGAGLLARRMTAAFSSPRLRPMQAGDLDTVLAWRNAPEIRRCMLQSDAISPDAHAAWFQRTSANPDRELLIVEAEGQPLGFVQFSGLQERLHPEWGFYAAPGAPKGSGTLLGTLALAYAFRTLHLPRLIGRALASNETSIRFHQKFGFRPQHAGANTGNPSLQTFELLREDWELAQGVNA